MIDIRHNVVIKASPEKIYKAITTQDGLSSWWAKQSIAKAEIGFVNIFTFGNFKNEMKVMDLVPNKKVTWQCIISIEEWIGTFISFELEERDGKTLLRFVHSGWPAISDMFATCNYDWGRFMTSLKLYCETGTGTPS